MTETILPGTGRCQAQHDGAGVQVAGRLGHAPSTTRSGEDFADAANRLAGFAGALLGWRPDEFWRATPAELATVVAVLSGGGATLPPDRATLTKLQEAFPDG